MKELKEYAANNAAVQYDLNVHVLGLYNYSTYAEMMKGYCSMARRFHPDNNYGFDTTEIMTMINMAKYGLQDQLSETDELREEERVQAAEYESSIPSYHNPDSESSGTSSEPASLHPRPWTSKKRVKKIKKLHVRCDGNDNIEQLYILPSRWLFLLKFDNFGDAIHEKFQNASCTPMQFLLKKF